jgi:integrase
VSAKRRNSASPPLFPAKRIPKSGVVLSSDAKPCSDEAVNSWFQLAEKLAGILHVPGRCAYGMRGAGTDAALEEGVSLEALQARWPGESINSDGDIPRPAVRLYDCRHTCATLLLEAGVPMRVVQEILRHSTMMLTANTYSHVRPALAQQAMAQMAAYLDKRDE